MSKTQGANPLFLYDSRAARAVRLVALAVIVATTFIGQPHASLSGHGLVILISLIVAAITQLVITLQATGSWALPFIVAGAASCSVLAGFDPTVGTAILMVFVGLSAGANFGFGTGGAVTALAVLITALSVLISGQGTGNITVGVVAVVGFLAAAGRKQYLLRAEEAELRLADAERGSRGARPGCRPGRAGQCGPGNPRHPGPQPGCIDPPARRPGCCTRHRARGSRSRHPAPSPGSSAGSRRPRRSQAGCRDVAQ